MVAGSTSAPRVVIAGVSSGVGKTTVATGLLAALAARGHQPVGFKVGPDFIDPSYHALATGQPGRNLDAHLSGPELIAPLFLHGARAGSIAVIEGVMGMFDGKTGAGEFASTAHVAKLLQAPVILVVDATATGRSVAAVVQGFTNFDRDVNVAGVIFNRVGSPVHESIVREAVADLGIPVLGVLPRDSNVTAPERHLGLVPAVERVDTASSQIKRLGAVVERGCDLEAIVRIASAATPVPGAAWDPYDGLPVGVVDRQARIGIASGPAFSFVYQENLELLAAAGGELVPFDPMTDEQLPDGLEGLYLGGGFPEVYGAGLSANQSMREHVAQFATNHPIVAECGGMLYLCDQLDDYTMCGVLPARATMGTKLSLGYRELVAESDSLIATAGAKFNAHEFHYSTIEPSAGTRPAWSTITPAGTSRQEGFIHARIHASYMHTHWAATPAAASNFIATAHEVSHSLNTCIGHNPHNRSATLGSGVYA